LFSDEPIYSDFEQLKLASYLTLLARECGVGDPLVKAILAGKSPRERAAELILGTKVKEVAVRKELFARTRLRWRNERKATRCWRSRVYLDPEARTTRKIMEEQSEVKRAGSDQDRQGSLCGGRYKRISRRYLHAPPRVRRYQRV